MRIREKMEREGLDENARTIKDEDEKVRIKKRISTRTRRTICMLSAGMKGRKMRMGMRIKVRRW